MVIDCLEGKGAVYVVTAREMQELDRRTINDIGIPGIVLMENAGRGTCEHVRSYFPEIPGKRIIVLCGRGNNGGDGFVIARCFHNAGFNVKAFLFADRARVSGDALTNLDAFTAMGGSVEEIGDEQQWKDAGSHVLNAGLVIDALLGTGLSSEVMGLYRRVIEDINHASCIPVVAVDIPSGIDATTGAVLGTAVRADLTCTFGLPKMGLILFPGAEYAGSLEVVDIGIPRSLVSSAAITAHLMDQSGPGCFLPARAADSHKGTYGHALILAGSPGKTGAAAMASQSAMRAGAGLVTLGVPRTLNGILEAKLTEVMTEPLPDFGEGFLGPESWHGVQAVMGGKQAIALGPGIGDRGGTNELVYNILQEAAVPVIVDADALNALAKNRDVLKKAKAPLILTPHPGEMARLAGTTTSAIQCDRVEQARKFSREFGAIVVLKGARTVIAEPSGHVYLNPTGNPGMASGGMGDVLTGIITGLAAQGISPSAAAQLGVFIHGRIGDALAGKRAPIGLLATDLIDMIPEALLPFVER